MCGGPHHLLDISRSLWHYRKRYSLLLEDLKEILELDILNLASLLLTDIQIQVKYRNKIGETFKQEIVSPQGDCANQIWFIFTFTQPYNLSNDLNLEIQKRYKTWPQLYHKRQKCKDRQPPSPKKEEKI